MNRGYSVISQRPLKERCDLIDWHSVGLALGRLESHDEVYNDHRAEELKRASSSHGKQIVSFLVFAECFHALEV